MIENSYFLRRIKEDILRILTEKKKKYPLASIKTEVKSSPLNISRAIEELEKDGLIELKKNFVLLTNEGKKKSKDILKKHIVLEKYFSRESSENISHKKADYLEHYISEEALENIKKINKLKKRGTSLTNFSLNKKAFIVGIDVQDDQMFERMVSMGISIGERIEMINLRPKCVIIRLENKKIALDKDIAKGIKVLKYEEN
jgi:Mn-dependent DtxR family transcriptional regulator